MADCGSSSNRRTGNSAEEHIGQNIGRSQIAGDLTHKAAGQTDQSASNAALVHDAACQHEERQSKQTKRVDAGETPLGHDVGQGIQIKAGKQDGDGCNADTDGDRHTHEHQTEEDKEQHQCCLYNTHDLFAPFHSFGLRIQRQIAEDLGQNDEHAGYRQAAIDQAHGQT